MKKIVKNVKLKSAIVGSSAGELSAYDKKSIAIYTGIASAALIITAFVNAFMPFLKLDATILDSEFIRITPGNFVTVFLTFLGVLIKKFGTDKSNVFIEQKIEEKTDEKVGESK